MRLSLGNVLKSSVQNLGSRPANGIGADVTCSGVLCLNRRALLEDKLAQIRSICCPPSRSGLGNRALATSRSKLRLTLMGCSQPDVTPLIDQTGAV